MKLYCLILAFLGHIIAIEAWGSGSKIKLSDVKTLTLHHDQLTTGRRTKSVPQVQCVGGTAGCKAFVPQVIQCYNRGSDGFDVQWECKTDMDNSYRFGRVDIICEGYDYPDDPYVLKGSCGLEYTLDLTEEGLKRKSADGSSYSHNYYDSGYNNYQSHKGKKSWIGNAIFVVIILLMMYAVYKTCLRNYQRSPLGDDYDDPSSHFRSGYSGFGSSSNAPPPPGFRPSYDDASGGCGASSTRYSGASTGANNFWTGAATGGILGYMFGSRNRDHQSYYEPRRSPTSSSFGSPPRSSGSTGTRTASGFGGTRRR